MDFQFSNRDHKKKLINKFQRSFLFFLIIIPVILHKGSYNDPSEIHFMTFLKLRQVKLD